MLTYMANLSGQISRIKSVKTTFLNHFYLKRNIDAIILTVDEVDMTYITRLNTTFRIQKRGCVMQASYFLLFAVICDRFCTIQHRTHFINKDASEVISI